MKYAKEALAVIIVVLLGAVGFIATERVLENEKGHSDGQYDYILSTGTSFAVSDSETDYAPEGQMFVFAAVLLKNLDWHDGISDDPSCFELVVNGERLNPCSYTYSYPLHKDSVLYLEGQQGQNYYVYLVPEGTGTDNAHIEYIGLDKIRYDPGLLAETSESEMNENKGYHTVVMLHG